MGAVTDLLWAFAGFLLLLGVPAAYAVAQLRMLRRWRGWPRAAAALPLPVWLLWGAKLAVDTAVDPTSHNLFPFEILFLALGSMAWLGFLLVVRHALATYRPS